MPLIYRLIVLTYVGSTLLSAQPPPRPRPGGGGPSIAPIEEVGFMPLFDGKTLKGWDGDLKFWRVEEGALVGETTTELQPVQNTFLIWRGGKPGNFELKLDYKLTGYNSGIQIRSIELPDIPFAMKGYQADMDGEQRFTGQIYEERGRGFMAMRGQLTYIGESKKVGLVGSLGGDAALKEFIKPTEWNSLHLMARGDTIIQILNGHVMSILIDEDTAGRKMDGLLGIQVHKGPAMKIEVKNIRLKNL